MKDLQFDIPKPSTAHISCSLPAHNYTMQLLKAKKNAPILLRKKKNENTCTKIFALTTYIHNINVHITQKLLIFFSLH